MEKRKYYIAIDLKSFYASVECIERGLDPMSTNLVVADESRTEKTICLAVTPSLKSHGISGRARLFEALEAVKAANERRRLEAPNRRLNGRSWNATELERDKSLAIGFIKAPPRMALYMEYSTRVYKVYLKHVSPDDIHVYSVDEVFIDATAYLRSYGISAYDFAKRIIKDVLATTGITATAGIGSNLYLCKVALDIMAKKVPADSDGVRIAELDEDSYKRELWDHRPLTDFWRVGRGYARALEANGMYTMGDVARCSIGDEKAYYNEELLYRLFGVNAELLVDHAWGVEPCTISDIKAYKPSSNSISSGQVLHCPYTADKARLVVREMTDILSLELVEKRLVTDQLVLTVGYDIDNLKGSAAEEYRGEIVTDHYGRSVPKHAHGTENLPRYTSSTKELMNAVSRLYDRIVNKKLLVRRITIAACRVIAEDSAEAMGEGEQLDIFSVLEGEKIQKEKDGLKKERRLQSTLIDIKKKHGKNSILKGMNFEEGATAKDRNSQIGGHKG
ncbi:MAG: DNA methylase [Clostridia bacterium]|nr:DNA methylase [Clostridia bacterium]